MSLQYQSFANTVLRIYYKNENKPHSQFVMRKKVIIVWRVNAKVRYLYSV